MIGIVVGLAAEARIAARLGCEVAVGGGTAAGAAAACALLVAQGAEALISFGLAGGLDPALRPGALVIPAAVFGGQACDARLVARLGGATVGCVVGGEAVVADAAAKRALHRRTGAAAVDLESGAVAAQGLAFAVLRAVCDPAGRDLPPAALAALDHRGAIGALRVLASVLGRPGQVPALLRLAADAAAARAALVGRVRAIGRL